MVVALGVRFKPTQVPDQLTFYTKCLMPMGRPTGVRTPNSMWTSLRYHYGFIAYQYVAYRAVPDNTSFLGVFNGHINLIPYSLPIGIYQ